MFPTYDLSYAVAQQHIYDLYREAAARRRIPPRSRRSRKPFGWLGQRSAATIPATCLQ